MADTSDLRRPCATLEPATPTDIIIPLPLGKLLQSTCCRAVVSGFSAVSAVSAAISILQSSRISMIMRAHLAVLVIALVAAQPASAQQPDPYIWLEQQTGDRAMAWVRAENAKT